MTLTRLALPATLAAALLAAPAFADPAEDLREAVKKFDKATKDLADARDALKSDELRGKVNTLDSKIDLIDQDIKSIQKDIRDIKRRLDNSGSSSLKTESLYQGQGKVRFINEYSEEMSVVVNGRSYRLQPGQEKLVAVTPGEFTYQVLQLQRSSQERRISADETKTIRIYPLP
jgi:hypothetical protein